jgi:hypothetical protein
MDYIPTSTCNNYNNIITKGIANSQDFLEMICFTNQYRSDL